MRDDDPITLKEACEIVFRNTCAVATLRAEADRGRLDLSKIGKRYYTTLRSARELYEKCRVNRRAQGSISTQNEMPGLSEMALFSNARAALRATLSAPASCSGDISPANTSRNRAQYR